MLTEKECREALEILKEKVNGETVDAVVCFKELIDEHFDNPPLKLEEIEVDMWVFDLKDSKYKKIESIYIDVNNNIATIGFDDYDEEIFEENRYYRKEVQE